MQSPNWASLLIIVEVTVALIALTGFALLAARLAPPLRQPRLALLVDRGLRVTLVGLGVHAIALTAPPEVEAWDTEGVAVTSNLGG